MRQRHQAAILGLALLLSGCGSSTLAPQTAVSAPTSAGSNAGTPSLAAPTPSPTPSPRPTPSLPPSPITVASVLKDFKAALPVFDTSPLPSVPSLKKYRPAPSAASLRALFAAVPPSRDWPAARNLTSCTNGKFAANDQTTGYTDLVLGCSFMLTAAVATAERTRDPATIAFAQGIVAYVAHLAVQVPWHGQELLDLCVGMLGSDDY